MTTDISPLYATDRESLERDTDMTFFVAGGPGGQHRNKVATGVRLLHRPSGVVIAATERRSQFANREMHSSASPRGCWRYKSRRHPGSRHDQAARRTSVATPSSASAPRSSSRGDRCATSNTNLRAIAERTAKNAKSAKAEP